MIDEILFKIGSMKWMVLFYLLITILVCAFFMFKTREFNWKRSNFIHFAYLYNLTKGQAISVALILGRFLFIVTAAVFPKNVFVGYYIVFVLFAIAIAAAAKDIKLLINGLLYYFVIYVLLYIESQLQLFYLTIDKELIVVIMFINLAVFNILAGLYLALGTYEDITKKRVINA